LFILSESDELLARRLQEEFDREYAMSFSNDLNGERATSSSTLGSTSRNINQSTRSAADLDSTGPNRIGSTATNTILNRVSNQTSSAANHATNMPMYHSQFERNMRSQPAPPATYATSTANDRIPDSFQNDLVNILAVNNNRRLNSQQLPSLNPPHTLNNQQNLTTAFNHLLTNNNNVLLLMSMFFNDFIFVS